VLEPSFNQGNRFLLQAKKNIGFIFRPLRIVSWNSPVFLASDGLLKKRKGKAEFRSHGSCELHMG